WVVKVDLRKGRVMQTRFLHLAEGTIAFDDQGQGPLVVCLPAGGDLRSEYRFLTPQLVKAGYRVVTVDLRGQGESSAVWPSYSAAAVGSDVLALIDQVNAGPAIVVATSVAAAGAIWAAAEGPAKIAGLVLVGCFARAASPGLMRLLTGVLLAPWWGRALYAAYFPKLYPSARPADFAEHLGKVRAMLGEPGRLRALRLLFATVGTEWDARLAQIRAPALILMGSRDPDFRQPEQEAQLLAERLSQAQTTVQIIAGAGHHPQAELPEIVGRTILAFFERLPELDGMSQKKESV
ncbi:MAG TPA: alpha/beta hydrolase, partial [Roseiflexaceae bacterium]|nr:alpha/beta hydrolase [Roseiflexaceae bacterium]